jgi:hypothetical protein
MSSSGTHRAVSHLEQSLDYARQTNNYKEVATRLRLIAEVHLDKRDILRSREIMLDALAHGPRSAIHLYECNSHITSSLFVSSAISIVLTRLVYNGQAIAEEALQ